MDEIDRVLRPKAGGTFSADMGGAHLARPVGVGRVLVIGTDGNV